MFFGINLLVVARMLQRTDGEVRVGCGSSKLNCHPQLFGQKLETQTREQMKETIPISASMSTKHRHDPNANQLIMAKATGATETLLMNSEVSGDGRPAVSRHAGRTTPPESIQQGNEFSNKTGENRIKPGLGLSSGTFFLFFLRGREGEIKREETLTARNPTRYGFLTRERMNSIITTTSYNFCHH